MALDSILIAQVNANTKALNKLNEDARKTSELPALPALDINDLIRVEKAGVSYKALASEILPPNSEFLEYIYNKQNDLSADGTGIMYPTVDAVNEGIEVFFKTDKVSDKTLKQTGLYRTDIDVSVLSIAPANTLNITAVDNVLFINEIAPDVPANVLDDYLKDFGDVTFVANTTNTNLPANTRGIFYVGLDKIGGKVYRTSKVYDQDVAYLARIIVENTAGVYTIVSFKYIPDLANNKINNHDRLVLGSGFIVPSGAPSISFGNRGMAYYKNSINYSINKLDPNYLTLTDSVNPAPMPFVFLLPNITSLATSLANSTVMNPTQWYNSAGAVGAGAVSNANYQVYKLYLSVTGTILIQTKASTSNAPQAGVNAIFANRDDALAGLTSVVFPSILPAGDSLALGTFYLRAGTAVNGSQLGDPNDFYFLPFTATASSSSVGVTDHDLLSNKNGNPAFQHVTATNIGDWNTAFLNRITGLTTTGNSGASTLVGGVLNVPNYSLAGLGGINFASIIAGFVTGANSTVLNTDSLEVAIEKLQGQINAKAGSFVAQPMTKIDDTNVTLTLGGTPATSLLQPVQLTLGWTGTLADSRIASSAIWNAKQNALTNPITGTIAVNRIPKAISASTLGNSLLSESTDIMYQLVTYGASTVGDESRYIFNSSGTNGAGIGAKKATVNTADLILYSQNGYNNSTEVARFLANGNVGIGGTPNARLDVLNGDIKGKYRIFKSQDIAIPASAQWVKLFKTASDNFGNIKLQCNAVFDNSIDSFNIEIRCGYYDLNSLNTGRPFVEVTHKTYNPKLQKVMIIKETGQLAVYLLINGSGSLTGTLYWNLDTLDVAVQVFNTLSPPANDSGAFVLPTADYVRANNFGYIQYSSGDVQANTFNGIKRYRAQLSFSGTNAPVATVMENSLGGTVVWTRWGVGGYSGTLSGAFPLGKVTCNAMIPLIGMNMIAFNDTANTVNVTTTTMQGNAYQDVNTTQATIEITVSP